MPLLLLLLRLASMLPLHQLLLPLPTLMTPLMLPLPRLLSLLPLTVLRRLPLSQPHTSTTDTMVVTDTLDTHMFSQLLQQRKSKIPADTEWKFLARRKVIQEHSMLLTIGQRHPGKSCYDSYLIEVRTTVKSKVYSETDTAIYHQCSLICKSSLPRNTLRYPM